MTTFNSFSKGVTGRLKSKRAIGEFDKSLSEGFNEAWGIGKGKKSKDSKKR